MAQEPGDEGRQTKARPLALPDGGSRPRDTPSGDVVVLLPALNEERAVGSVIERIPCGALAHRGYDVRVWVVDGQSTDATLQVARDHGANVFVQRGDGKGNAIRQVLAHLLDEGASPAHPAPRMIVMLDADGTYPPERIPDFVEALETGSDVVLGSRFRGRVEDGAVTPLNRVGNRMLSGLAGFLFRVPVSDVCTGMWAFREDALRHLGLAADGFDLEADLFASSCEAGARVRELPIDYGRRVGEPKLVPIRTGLLIAWRLLMRRLRQGDDAPTALGAEGPARPREGPSGENEARESGGPRRRGHEA